ncbi:BCL-6 corepressor-like protein 1, partial [Amphibalanus amphitrite]|uniref:BCL-6 corepressor-like protein 1 n=1 Tax=Amphibalanus amphitrite TaxID=1232801 RepID=UPI001C91CA41
MRGRKKRRKSGDMHTKLTLDDKPLLGDMPKLEEFATVCCRLCKCPVKMQSVKDHMALRHPDYSAARLREEAERFQVKIMINSIPESLFAAVPSYKSHMLSPVHVTSPVAPCVPDVVDDDTAAVVDMIGSLAPVPSVPPTPATPAPPSVPSPCPPSVPVVVPPPAPPVVIKEEPPEVKQELVVGGVEVVSSEEPLGAVLSLKTEVVPGAFVDILNEFESDAGAADETAAAVAAISGSPLAAAPLEPEPPMSVFSSPPLPPPPAPAAPTPPAVSPRVPSKAEFKSVPSSPSRPLTDTADASSISEHFAKMRASGSGGSLCSKKSKLGHQPRQYDPRKHCGVWITERNKNCTRVLDCRQHNLEQKSKVSRPVPFKDLLARFKAGKTRERDTIKPMSMRFDPKFVPPEGHPASAAAAAAAVSPSRQGGMVTYHNITNSPVFRRDRSSSADDDGMPPPSGVPPRAAAAASARPPPPPPEPSVPRIPSHPQPLAVGGALHLSSRGGCLSLVDQTSQLRAAFRSMFQPARRGQQSLLKVNQTRAAPATAAAPTAVTATANGQLTPTKRPPESPAAV